MEKEDYKNMSNKEIKIKMVSLENKYEKIKSTIRDLIKEMQSLDDEYISAKKELNNRNKGVFNG